MSNIKYHSRWREFILKEQEESEEECNDEENISCNCVARSESDLEIRNVQNFLANVYGIGSSGLTVSFSGQFGTAGEGFADGVCGPETRKFIMRFQREYEEEELCVDGCVGEDTEAAMHAFNKQMFKFDAFEDFVEKGERSQGKTALKQVDTKTNAKTDSSNKSHGASSWFNASTARSFTSVSPGVGDTASPNSNATISIKGRIHTHGSKKKEDLIPGLINAANIHDELEQTGLFKVRKNRLPWGNPHLSTAVIAAARAVDKINSSKVGIPIVGNISSEEGGPIGASASHQVGLDLDCSFYNHKQMNTWFEVNEQNFNHLFDIPRNVVFMHNLVKNPNVKYIFIDKEIKRLISFNLRNIKLSRITNAEQITAQDLYKVKIKTLWNSIKDSPKLHHEDHHADHYHIRVRHPKNSMYLNNYLRSLRKKKTSSFRSTSTEGLKEIEKLKFKHADKFGFVFGTVDGKVIESYNERAQFYGASMNKTMAALVQLIIYKDSKEQQLTDRELSGILSYRYGAPNTNKVNRSISAKYKGSDDYKRPHGQQPGRITHKQIGNIAKIFKVKKSKFLWASESGDNLQTPEDTFNFFAALARMNNGNPKGDLEIDFYEENHEAVERIIKATKNRKHNPRWTKAGHGTQTLQKLGFWGKGGLWAGAINLSVVINDTHVLTIYSRMGRWTRESSSGKKSSINNQGFSVLRNIIRDLMMKYDIRKGE